jgi:hypothetical protein
LKAIQKEKSEKIKEIFKELWLKYANYEKCIEELEKIGIKRKKKTLESLRCDLKLPKMYELLLKNKKCFYCGNNAKIMFGLRRGKHSPKSTIFVCMKCYKREETRIRRSEPEYKEKRKIEYIKYYKKHKNEILRRHKAQYKSFWIYLGKIICKKCLKDGYLLAHFKKTVSTGHIIGPWFYVNHQYCTNGKRHSVYCYIGKDEDLERRFP